eukprot:m.434736 g.434736  ORF g.434736 m.434736 type:complete len:261 (-) comp17757_c0_seq1:789-1571(-)
MAKEPVWPKDGSFELEYPLGGSALPPPCLVFKANKELLGLLGVGSGTGRKRRRETPLTLQFDDKAKGSLLVSGVPSAPFDIKFNKEDDGAVTECFDATSELQAAGTVLGRVQFGRPGSDQKAIAAVSGAYRASAAKRGKTRHVSTAVFRTDLTSFDLPTSKVPAIVDDADMEAQVAQYTRGREQFIKVNDELKGLKKTIQSLGRRWRELSGPQQEQVAKEIKAIYREHDEVYAERFDYCKKLQTYLSELRTRIIEYQEQT